MKNETLPILSERGELVRGGDETHPILSEMASDLLAHAEENRELAQPKAKRIPQWPRIEPRFGELCLNSLDQSFFFFHGFWISFKSMLKWDCELGAKTQAVGAEAVPEFCRTLTLRERSMGLSSHWEYRSPTRDEAVTFDNFRLGAWDHGDMSSHNGWSELEYGTPSVVSEFPFRLLLARPSKRDESARLAN